MMYIREIKEMVLRSLILEPSTSEELKRKHFLKHISDYGIERLFQTLEREGVVRYNKVGMMEVVPNLVKKKYPEVYR